MKLTIFSLIASAFLAQSVSMTDINGGMNVATTNQERVFCQGVLVRIYDCPEHLVGTV